jgi:hypothetical protein
MDHAVIVNPPLTFEGSDQFVWVFIPVYGNGDLYRLEPI